MRVRPFELMALTWRGRACQWWRLWDSQGGTFASLRGLPLSRLAAGAAAAARECSRLADLFQALADVYPLGLTWQTEGDGRKAALAQ